LRKSVRERYILVAAIDKVIRAGVWNIWVAGGVRQMNNPHTRSKT